MIAVADRAAEGVHTGQTIRRTSDGDLIITCGCGGWVPLPDDMAGEEAALQEFAEAHRGRC